MWLRERKRKLEININQERNNMEIFKSSELYQGEDYSSHLQLRYVRQAVTNICFQNINQYLTDPGPSK